MSGTTTFYRHNFSVTNGRIKFENQGMYETQLQLIEGQKGFLIFYPEDSPTSVAQKAFFYGGIVRGSCLPSNVFQGLNVREIADVLAFKLRPYQTIIKHPDGTEEVIHTFEDIDGYNKKQMAMFIEDVIRYLETEFNIQILNPKAYKMACKVMDKKELKKH